MKLTEIWLLIVFSAGLVSISSAQVQVTSTPTPSSLNLSEQLSKKLESYDNNAGVERTRREQAYVKLFEAQRAIYRMQLQRTQNGRALFADLARAALIASLESDPGLSESYVALAEVSILTSLELDEPVALCTLAIKLNKDSIGGHKFLARLLTKQSGLRGSTIDADISARAIQEWKEVTRLDPRNAEAWSLLSEFYESTGRTNEAIESLRKWVAASTPVDSGWFRQIVGGRPEELLPEQAPQRLSGALIRAGRTREAVEILAQQLSDDPDNADVMAQVQEAFETAKPDATAAVIEPIRQVVESHPGSIVLLQFFASLDAKVGNIDDAVKMLGNAIQRYVTTDRPAAANLQLTVGDVYLSRDRFSEAAAAYEKAIAVRGLDSVQTLDPDEREFVMTAFDKLITAYKRSNRIGDAKSAVQRARKLLGRDDIFADKQLISLYRETGDREQALSIVRGVRQRNADDISMLRLEATLLMEMGQVDSAVELVKRRIASGRNEVPIERFGGNGPAAPRLDDDFSNYVFISQLYNDAGRGVDAAAAANQAFGVAGSEDRRQIARLMSATAKQTAGQFGDAESILRDILKKSPGNPIALNNLGYFLLERNERFPEALELIKRAVAIDPTNPSYLDSLGWAYFKLDQIDDSITTLREAVRRDETSATIHEHLGDAYRKKGSLEQARVAWQRASVLVSGPTDAARVKEKLENLK